MPRGNIPSSTNTYHSLMDFLRLLQIRMSHTGTKSPGTSCIEWYDNIIRSSEFGRDCQYAEKTLAMFKQQDYNDIRDLIYKLYDIFQQLEKGSSS
jgi:hypothetical protein